MSHILEINSATKIYSDFMLNAVSLSVPYGKVVGLIGENGAGKTTLIGLIMNQISRDKGTIKIFEKDNLTEEKLVKSDIGFVVDECCYDACLTSENISSILRPIYKKWDENVYLRYLERFDIDKKKKISEMSKGMKSKMMLATALSHDPHLLILDEITSGLDPVVRDDILHILREFVTDETKSVFFSTHITSDLDKIADDVAFLHKGNLVFMDSIESLKQKYVTYICSSLEAENLDNALVVAHYSEGNKHNFLLKKSDNIPDTAEIPTIDDIMLLYIKGRG